MIETFFIAATYVFIGIFTVLFIRYSFPATWIKKTGIYADDEREKYYDCLLGDNIKRAESGIGFSGLEVTLPKKFPHIILDSQLNDKKYDINLAIKSHEKLQLEGDFNEYFQLFAAEEYRLLALSVLTPDVMQVLMQKSDRFDIEIMDNKLRILSEKGVRNKPHLQTELQETAEYILNSMKNKLQNWNDNNIQDVSKNRLSITDKGVVKFGKSRYVPSIFFLLSGFLILVALPFWVQAARFIRAGDPSGVVLVGAGLLFYPLGYFVIRKIVPFKGVR